MFIILNAFYEILMSTSETRNDEAVLFIIIKKNLTKISFVSSRFWIVVVHYTWTEAWTMTDCCGAQLKVQEMGKKKDTSDTEVAFLRESLFSTWYR